MIREYMFNDADNMIDLAKDIQSNVYWGGTFLLGDEYVKWKDLWDIISAARAAKSAIGILIKNNDEVRFLYKEGANL